MVVVNSGIRDVDALQSLEVLHVGRFRLSERALRLYISTLNRDRDQAGIVDPLGCGNAVVVRDRWQLDFQQRAIAIGSIFVARLAACLLLGLLGAAVLQRSHHPRGREGDLAITADGDGAAQLAAPVLGAGSTRRVRRDRRASGSRVRGGQWGRGATVPAARRAAVAVDRSNRHQ